MATETLTIWLDAAGDIDGRDFVTDEDDTQIVTILDGGAPDDFEYEAADDDREDFYIFEFWGKGTANNPGESLGGNDVFKIDLAGFDNSFGIEVKSMDQHDEFWISNYDSWTTDGHVHTFMFTGSNGQPYTFILDAESQNWGDPYVVTVSCFTDTAWIETPEGERHIAELSEGDLVVCGDGIARPIRWIGSSVMSKEALEDDPSLCPISIPAGSLGPNMPTRDTELSPQHRVLFGDWRMQLMFGTDSALIPAKAMTEIPGVTKRGSRDGVTYYHILLDYHQTVNANGLPCETLLPAEMTQNGLSSEARAEILKIFPTLVSDLRLYGDLSHTSLTVREGRAYLTSFGDDDAA